MSSDEDKCIEHAVSPSADDFEDLGKDAETLQLRQRRGGTEAAEPNEPAAATAASDAKKGR